MDLTQFVRREEPRSDFPFIPKTKKGKALAAIVLATGLIYNLYDKRINPNNIQVPEQQTQYNFFYQPNAAK